jgi:hypothetical protein
MSCSVEDFKIAYWCGLQALFWVINYETSHCLAVAPQLHAKKNFIVLLTIQTVKLREHLKI